MEHGVTADTKDRILFDAGAVYLNYVDPSNKGDLLGATKGGSEVEINVTVRDFSPDGSKGKVKGYQRIENAEARMTVNLFEVTAENIAMAIAGAIADQGVVTGGEILEGEYVDSVALIGDKSDGGSAIIVLHNVLGSGSFRIGMRPKDEAVVPVTFEAHFDPASMDEYPWEITIIDAGS